MTMHYHGTPITPREQLFKLAGHCFCVSFAAPRDVEIVHQIGQSVMLDNGAYTFWRDPSRPSVDWDEWARWVEPWLEYPTSWAVLPDVIGGSEEANDRLANEYAWLTSVAAPVWHLHESLERLQRLCDSFSRVCFGSSGAYAVIGTDQWHRRVSEAFDMIASPAGRVPWIHMLRGMSMAGEHYPFASVDSANAARNHAGSSKAKPRPIEALVQRVDALQCPGRWCHVGTQTSLEGTA